MRLNIQKFSKQRLVKFGRILILVVGILLPVALQAAEIEFTPEVPIPGVFDEKKTVTNNFIGEYIAAIYTYFIWTVGLLATFMVVYGGVKWVSAAGNPGRINDARETINNAIIGVIIALSSYLLLNVINPDFVKLGLPEITSVQTKYFVGANAPTLCSKDLKVDCNTIRLIDGNTEPKTYCMGAQCGESEICSLNSVSSPTGPVFSQGAGCVNKIKFNPPLVDSGVQYPEVRVEFSTTDNVVRGRNYVCGRIVYDCATKDGPCRPLGVGNTCEGDNANKLCYSLGLTSKEKSTVIGSNTIFSADNIFCGL